VSQIADKILRCPALSIAVGIAAVSALGLLAWFIFSNAIAMDFSVYWRAANEPLETVYQPRATLNFPYPPTMLLWIEPLARTPLRLAFVCWLAVSIGGLVFASRRYLSIPQITLCLFSPPMFYALLNGQVTIALSALLLWACGTRSRLSAGAAFAVVATIKPHLVIMAPLLLLASRDWRALVSASLAFAAVCAASIIAYGAETWLAWYNSLEHFNAILIKNDVLMVAATPYGVARYWDLPPLPFLVLGAAIGAWLAVRCRNMPPLSKCAAIAAGSLLAAPYAVIYDLSPVIPFLVLSVFRGSVGSALAIGGALNPIPLVLTALALLKGRDSLPLADSGRES
jgi:hypothetical protein